MKVYDELQESKKYLMSLITGEMQTKTMVS